MKSVKRLFEQFHPENYALDLTPDAVSMSFTGVVTVTGRKTGRPSQRLTFHQKGLDITRAEVIKHDKKGDEQVVVDRINVQKSFDEVRLHTKTMLYPGNYTVKLTFKGIITKQMHGMYPCFFTDNGTEKVLLATQFESHHAREVFPCIDEPEAKATFDLTLTSPKDEVVLANTPIKSQKTSGKLATTTFETTPVMSTYLLAWAIGDIHCVESKTKDNIEVRTWASAAQPASSLQFANDEAVKVLEFFTDYFQTPFPLKKVDQIALPDFESGAMENWGLITYREIALLTDAENRSLTSEQYVAMVVAHELSHQWFGNLVTMRWWDDLWLNESFASIMEHIALDALHPDWYQWENYAASDMIACSNRDIYKDVQPVRVDVHHPDEIGTLFDPAIVYAKGGRLLKMLREYIGDEAFRVGLKDYFTAHAYKNTTRDDLWKSLSKASGHDIHAFMNPWLEQSGMPVVTLKKNKSSVTARQERFILDSNHDKQLWPVPTLAAEVAPALFTTREADLTGTRTPFILNEHGSGHYVVNYADEDMQQAVNQAFSNGQLPSESRINYLNDLMLLARRGDTPLATILEVIGQSGDEPRDAVWALMSRGIGLAASLTEGDEATEKDLRAFRRRVAGPLHARLGWDDKKSDDPNTQLLRLTGISWMISGEDPAALKEASKRYEAAKGNIDQLNSEHRAMILGCLMRQEPSRYFDHLIETYKTSQNPEVQIAVASGLASLKDEKIGKELINLAMGDGKPGFVRSQDIFRWFAYLMRNRHTRQATWDWFQANWDRLYDEFGESKSMDHFVVYAAGPITTKEWQKKFNDFFVPKLHIVALTRNIKIAQAEIAARTSWRARDEASIKAFFGNEAL